MADNLGTSVSVGQGATETYYVPGHPRYDAVRLDTDSANTASPDVTVEIRTRVDDEPRTAKDNSDFSNMQQVSKTTNVDASSGDPVFGAKEIGRVVAIRVTENNNAANDDYSGTIKFHNADDPAESAESWLDPYNASEEMTQTRSLSPGFGSWTTADADRGTWIEVDASVETDGTSKAQIDVDVDESGGTTADYQMTVAHIAPDNSTGTTQIDSTQVFIPSGAQFQINNVSDPNSNNAINHVRHVEK